MTTPYAYATPQTEIGIALETTRGTGVYPAYWFKIKNPKYKPDLTWNPDQTLQGSMVKTYNLVPGMRYDAHGWDSYPYLDSFPLLLRALMGSADNKTSKPGDTTMAANAAAGATTIQTHASVAANSWIIIGAGATMETHFTSAVSGTADPFTVTLAYPLLYAQISTTAVTGLTQHQISLLNNGGSGNQSPTLTLLDYAGDVWRELTAGTLDALTLKGTAGGIVEYTTNLFCNAAITPTTPTASFSSVQATPGWTTQVLIGGSPVKYYVDWQFDFKRNVKPIPAFTGSQQYLLYFQDALDSMGKITVLLQNGSPELAAYEAGTVQAFDFTVYDMTNGNALNIHSTSAQFSATGGIDRSKEWVEVPLDVQLLPSSTDAQSGGVAPVIFTVANAVTGAY